MYEKVATKNPIISVIIASYTATELLPQCLKSILQEKTSLVEIIVVNDGFDKNEFNNLVGHNLQEPIRIIHLPHNTGAAKARNVGVYHARGSYLFFIDNDTRLQSGWSRKVPAFFKKYKKTGIAQVKLLTDNTTQYDSAGELLSPLGFLVERAQKTEDRGQFETPDVIFSGKSAGMIVRRDVFEKLRGFDEDFHIFWEDTDLCWRSWILGFEVRFFPDVVIDHAYLTNKKDKNIYLKNRVFYHGSRNMIQSTIRNVQMYYLLIKVPTLIFVWLVLATLFFLKLDFYKSSEIMKGIIWNIIHIPQTMRKRTTTQQSRNLSDQELYSLVGVKQPMNYYLRKAQAYILQKPF